MSNKGRRDGERRPAERRDSQPDDEQRRQPGDLDKQEGESLTALKAILGKVAALLPELKLKPDESVSVVEQLYGSVLEMDLKLAGETDDKRKASVLAHIKNTKVTRANGKVVVEFPKDAQVDRDAPATDKPDNGKGKAAGAKKAAPADDATPKEAAPAKEPAPAKETVAPSPAPPADEPADEPAEKTESQD